MGKKQRKLPFRSSHQPLAKRHESYTLKCKRTNCRPSRWQRRKRWTSSVGNPEKGLAGPEPAALQTSLTEETMESKTPGVCIRSASSRTWNALEYLLHDHAKEALHNQILKMQLGLQTDKTTTRAASSQNTHYLLPITIHSNRTADIERRYSSSGVLFVTDRLGTKELWIFYNMGKSSALCSEVFIERKKNFGNSGFANIAASDTNALPRSFRPEIWRHGRFSMPRIPSTSRQNSI